MTRLFSLTKQPPQEGRPVIYLVSLDDCINHSGTNIPLRTTISLKQNGGNWEVYRQHDEKSPERIAEDASLPIAQRLAFESARDYLTSMKDFALRHSIPIDRVVSLGRQIWPN